MLGLKFDWGEKAGNWRFIYICCVLINYLIKNDKENPVPACPKPKAYLFDHHVTAAFLFLLLVTYIYIYIKNENMIEKCANTSLTF